VTILDGLDKYIESYSLDKETIYKFLEELKQQGKLARDSEQELRNIYDSLNEFKESFMNAYI
jgi:hypothetical protein